MVKFRFTPAGLGLVGFFGVIGLWLGALYLFWFKLVPWLVGILAGAARAGWEAAG